jgi:Rrf2 family protein
MKLSTRSRYGLRAALELALEYGNGPLQIKIIAKREGISSKYLEQLVGLLKSSGLVNSVRGPRGGYLLARPPEQIKLSEVFITLEGDIVDIECLQSPDRCQKCPDCATRSVWLKLQEAIFGVLDGITLKDLANMVSNEKSITYQI